MDVTPPWPESLRLWIDGHAHRLEIWPPGVPAPADVGRTPRGYGVRVRPEGPDRGLTPPARPEDLGVLRWVPRGHGLR